MLHSSIVASPIPGTPRWRLVSGSLCACSLCVPHGIATDTRIQFWRTLAASVHRVSQLHSDTPFLPREFPFFQIGRSRQADAPLLPVVQEILQPEPSQSPNPSLWCRSGHRSLNTNSPKPRHCPFWFQLLFIYLSVAPLLASRHMLCSCHLDISRPFCLPTQPNLPSLPRVRDCQPVRLGPRFMPTAPTSLHVLPLWTFSSAPSPKSSSTMHPFALVVAHTVSRPRLRQPLWCNDACNHALVVCNGSWRDFRRSGSLEDQGRFRLLRQQFSQHSSFLQDPLLERVAWICDVPLPPCSQACVLSHPPHLPVPCCHT